MTKRKSKSTKSTVKAAAAKRSVTKSSAVPAIAASPTLIVLGFDEQQKPRGARFVDAKPDLVTKVADLLGFKVYEATPPDVAEAAKKLPLGRLYANGRGHRARPKGRHLHPAVPGLPAPAQVRPAPQRHCPDVPAHRRRQACGSARAGLTASAGSVAPQTARSF